MIVSSDSIDDICKRINKHVTGQECYIVHEFIDSRLYTVNAKRHSICNDWIYLHFDHPRITTGYPLKSDDSVDFPETGLKITSLGYNVDIRFADRSLLTPERINTILSCSPEYLETIARKRFNLEEMYVITNICICGFEASNDVLNAVFKIDTKINLLADHWSDETFYYRLPFWEVYEQNI